jgi:plasmid replication initiation protein
MKKNVKLCVPNKPIIYKNVKFIELKNEFSLICRKVFNCIIYDIFYNGFIDVDKLQSSIPMNELLCLLNQTHRHYDIITQNARKLMSVVIETEVTNKKGETKTRMVSLLRSCEIDKNKFVYQIEEEVLDLILQPEVYQSLQLSIMNNFTSKNSLAMYENIKRFENVKTTGFKSVEHWRNVLCGDVKEYDTFKMFHNKVIKHSVNQINNVSDIKVDYEFEKNGRNVIGIKFNIQKRKMGIVKKTTERTLSLIIENKMTMEEVICRRYNDGHIKLKERLDKMDYETLAINIFNIESCNILVDRLKDYFVDRCVRDGVV